MFKEPLKVRFTIDSKLSNELPTRRYSDYVLIPEVPTVQILTKLGINGQASQIRKISPQDEEALQMGESTIKTLKNEKNKHVCPRVLFPSNGRSIVTTNHNGDGKNEFDVLYDEHFISTYVPKMIHEKQYTLHLHIATHGDNQGIGNENQDPSASKNPKPRVSIEDFAGTLANLLTEKLHEKQIHVFFHCCNSAYCEINEKMSEAEISQEVRYHSLIGKFATQMKKIGFKNLSVSGYRGFYSHGKEHTYSVVFSDLTAKPDTTMNAKDAEFTITPEGSVILPSKTKARVFHVDLLEAKKQFEKAVCKAMLR